MAARVYGSWGKYLRVPVCVNSPEPRQISVPASSVAQSQIISAKKCHASQWGQFAQPPSWNRSWVMGQRKGLGVGGRGSESATKGRSGNCGPRRTQPALAASLQAGIAGCCRSEALEEG